MVANADTAPLNTVKDAPGSLLMSQSLNQGVPNTSGMSGVIGLPRNDFFQQLSQQFGGANSNSGLFASSTQTPGGEHVTGTNY